MENSKRNMRIAGIIQIVLGIGTILLTYFLMAKGDASAAGLSAKKSLAILVMTYGCAGFQILAGLIGAAKAGKKSLLTVVLGVILFIPQLWNFYSADGKISLIIVNIILLAIPYFYMSSAYKCYKNND